MNMTKHEFEQVWLDDLRLGDLFCRDDDPRLCRFLGPRSGDLYDYAYEGFTFTGSRRIAKTVLRLKRSAA